MNFRFLVPVFFGIILLTQTVAIGYAHVDSTSTPRGRLTVTVEQIELVDSERLTPFNELTNIPYGSGGFEITPDVRRSLCLQTQTSSSDSGPMMWDEENEECYQRGSVLDDGANGETELLIKFRTNHVTHIDPREVDGLNRNYIGLEFEHMECTNAASAPYASTATCTEWTVRDTFDLDRIIYFHNDCIEMEEAIVAVHGVSVGDDELRNAISSVLSIGGGVGLFVPGVGQLASIAALFALAIDQRDVDFGEDGVSFTKDDLEPKILLTDGDGPKLRIHLEASYTELEDESCNAETSLLTDPPYDELDEQYSAIPGWVKQNADWWAQGLISDRDFAAGLGFMVQSKIIQVDNVDFDPNGGLEISDNMELPDWIKQNARWWADGAINDSDFKSGIQHMIKEDVISFKEKSKINSPLSHLDAGPEIDAALIKKLYVLNKWNELTANWLIEIKNAETKIFDDLSEKTWKEYSDNKNKLLMNQATDYELAKKQSEKQATDSVDVLHKIKNSEKIIIKIAKNNGISTLELEKESKIPQEKIDDVKNLKTSDDIKDAYKDANKANKESLKKNKEIIDGFNFLNSGNPNLSPEEADTYSFGIVFTPDFVDGLTLTVDYYDIEIDDGISYESEIILPDLSSILNNDLMNSTGSLSIPDDVQNDDNLTGLDDDLEEESQTKSIGNDASNDSTIPDDDITNDDFTIEASPMSLTLSNGEYGEILVKTKSLYGWESPVQITTPVIPSPMVYPPGYPHYVYPTPEFETSSTIPVQIFGDACTGEYILRIFGYGEHPAPDRILEVHEVRVAINTVREPSLELDSLEDSITIVQGGSHTFQLSFKSLDYADYSYIVGTVDPFFPPTGVIIATPPTFVSVPEQTTVYAPVTITTSENTPAPFTFELPIYAETGLGCYNPYREITSVTVNVVPLIEEETEMVQLIPVTALNIGDQQYPISQFTLWQWEGECDDQWHYHSPTGHAISLDGITGISDPDQENCGFGKVSSFPNLTAWMSQSEIDNFKAVTGYDPLNSEAMMGGSGP